MESNTDIPISQYIKQLHDAIYSLQRVHHSFCDVNNNGMDWVNVVVHLKRARFQLWYYLETGTRIPNEYELSDEQEDVMYKYNFLVNQMRDPLDISIEMVRNAIEREQVQHNQVEDK